MRFSLQAYWSGLLFLRLALTVCACIGLPLVISECWGPGFAAAACLFAFPLWWFHFGLPRFKRESGGGILSSPWFCLWGYGAITLILLASVLEVLGIIKEGQPLFRLDEHRRMILRRVVLVAVVCVSLLYEYARRGRQKEGG